MRALLLAALLAAPPAVWADALESAMGQELERAMTQLRQEGYPPAYYLSLTAIDIDSWEQRCQMGPPTFTGQFSQRIIMPDLRVGDYALDNHPINNPSGYQARAVSVEEDEWALRHALWRQLDGLYKSASADFLRKQALRLSRGKTDYDTDDLSRQAPRLRQMARPKTAWDIKRLERYCLEPGRAFRRRPGLLSAEVSLRLRRSWSRLRDSEGSAVDFGRDVAEIELEAVDIAEDGMKLSATRRFLAVTPQALPTDQAVIDAADDMLKDLEQLKQAKSTSPFNAPALLDPSVAAVVVLSLGMRLSGEETRDPAGAQTFRGKLGSAVLPEAFTLVDDPTRREFQGKPLAGHYEFDDQGVAPRPVTLVEKGVLKSMLLSRYPVVGIPRSNGHGRAFAGYPPEGRPGALFLSAEKALSEKELLARLVQECRKRGKPYGIWVRKLRAFTQQQGTGGHTSIRLMGGLVYLVDAATGKLTLVRDLDLVGTPLVLMGNILAAGKDLEAQNMLLGVPISVVVSSLLLSDAELQRSQTRPEKPPILPPPTSRVTTRTRRVPTIPVAPHVQVQRYVIKGAKTLPAVFVMAGVVDSRRHLEGQDAVLDFKVVGATLPELGATMRRLDKAVERLAEGRVVESAALSPSMTLTSYRAQFGDGWPR